MLYKLNEAARTGAAGSGAVEAAIHPTNGFSNQFKGKFARSDPRYGSGERHRAEHDRHDRRGSVHHHAAGFERNGWTAGAAGVDSRRSACSLRWSGVCGIGRGAAALGRTVPLPARNLWPAEMGTPAVILVYLATFV